MEKNRRKMLKRPILWYKSLFQSKSSEKTISIDALRVSALPTIEQILKRPDSRLPENYIKFLLPAPIENKEMLIGPIDKQDNGDEKIYDLSPIIHHAVTLTLEQINLLY